MWTRPAPATRPWEPKSGRCWPSTLAATPYFETPGGGAAATLVAGGALIGPYRIIRELASGGMGSVYLAERDDGEFRQRVAIKIVRGGFANALLLQRFRDERQILASLDHPNIARLLDGGTTAAGLPYVVMEFVEGEPIDVFCANRVALAAPAARASFSRCAPPSSTRTSTSSSTATSRPTTSS